MATSRSSGGPLVGELLKKLSAAAIIICALAVPSSASARNNPDPVGSAFWAWACPRPELPSQSFGSAVLAKYPEWAAIRFREDGGDYRTYIEDGAKREEAICVMGEWVYANLSGQPPAAGCLGRNISYSFGYSLDYCQEGAKTRLQVKGNSCELPTAVFVENGYSQYFTRYMYPGSLAINVSTIGQDMNLAKSRPGPIRCLGKTVRSPYGFTDIQSVPFKLIRAMREKAVCVLTETFGDWRGRKTMILQNNYIDPKTPWKPRCGRGAFLLK